MRVKLLKVIIALLSLNAILLAIGTSIELMKEQESSKSFVEIRLETSCELLHLWVEKRYAPIPSEIETYYGGQPFRNYRADLRDLLRQSGREAQLSKTPEGIEIGKRLLPIYKSKKWDEFASMMPGVTKVMRIINTYCPN